MPAPTPASISIESTIQAFQTGLTNLSLPAAASVCDGLAAKIRQSDQKEALGVADLLGQLAAALRADSLDIQAVGDLMKRAGAHTAELAALPGNKQHKDRLHQLGGYVKGAGIALMGGTRPDEIAGFPTETSGGDPSQTNLQSINRADATGDPVSPAGSTTNMDVSDDVMAQPSDETPGEAPFSPK